MSIFTFWKGFADAAVGVILLQKPEIIYHSVVAKALNRVSGLRLPNPHPTSPGEISSQHAVAIMVLLFDYRKRPKLQLLTCLGYCGWCRSYACQQEPKRHSCFRPHECTLVYICFRNCTIQASSCNKCIAHDRHQSFPIFQHYDLARGHGFERNLGVR